MAVLWDEFANALSKDLSLSGTDKLHYLKTAMQSEEAQDIVSIGSRGGKDYDAVVMCLKQRYDRPRETCRLVVRQFLDYDLHVSHQGLGRNLTLVARTMATLAEHTDCSAGTLMTLLLELNMPPTLFTEWMKESAEYKKAPTVEQYTAFVEKHRRGLATALPGIPIIHASCSHHSYG